MKQALTAALSIVIATSMSAAQYTLVELEPLPGGRESLATGIDAQGRIVGTSRSAGGFRMAVVWPSSDQSPVALGLLDGGLESDGVAILDGLAIGIGDRPCGQRGAFAWSAADGLQAFGPDTCSATEALGVNASGDALLLLGTPSFPVIWPVDDGTPRFLETWDQPASVFHIDDAGRVVGASAFHPEGGGITRAVQWNADGTTLLLPRIDSSASGPDVALHRNDQGLIVGQARSDGKSRAVIWNGADEPIDAGTLLGVEVSSSLISINGTGQAVGSSSLGAITWDADEGTRLLRDLIDASVDGWTLSAAQDINDAGQIVGNGISPRGDVRGFALLTGGGACTADLDGDGSLSIFDFLAFQNLFDSGDTRADFDGDGSLTIFDFLAFQTAFDAGC